MEASPWLERAQREGFALGAFNAASIETLKAIVGAAFRLSSPVIIEASQNEVAYFGLAELVATVRALEKDTSVPIILNLDHAPDFASCRQAIEAGFDYIHIDGSKLAYEENVQVTRRVVGEAHARGLLVEGEVDRIGGTSADHRDKEAHSVERKAFSDPMRAAEFVAETGIDTLAAFVGNVHGLYQGEKKIDLELLARIHEKLGGKFLSLHGGSGIAEEQIRAAIKLGVVKINVNSELRVAFHDALKESLGNQATGGEVAVYKFMPAAIEAVQKVVEAKILLFGSAGKI